MTATTRVAVAGAYPAVRAGLRALLADAPTIDLDPAVGPPDVVVVDLGDDPEANLRLATAAHPSAALVLIAPDPATYTDLATAGLPVRAWLTRDIEPEQLAAAVLGAAAGLVVLDPEVAPTLARDSARREQRATGEPLTGRERDVLQLLAEGLPNKTIALRLGISDHTVKFHAGSIFAKLGAASRTEAAMLAARQGLVTL